MKTVDDLIKVLEECKERYPEFGKYIICIDDTPDYAVFPVLKEVKLYINTDIGQVEFTHD